MGRWAEVAMGWRGIFSRRKAVLALAAAAMMVLLAGIPGARPLTVQAAGEAFGPIHPYEKEGSLPLQGAVSDERISE